LSAVGVQENAGRAGEGEGEEAESERCENEVCEMGTNLAGIVIASAKRHGERELKKEELKRGESTTHCDLDRAFGNQAPLSRPSLALLDRIFETDAGRHVAHNPATRIELPASDKIDGRLRIINIRNDCSSIKRTLRRIEDSIGVDFRHHRLRYYAIINRPLERRSLIVGCRRESTLLVRELVARSFVQRSRVASLDLS